MEFLSRVVDFKTFVDFTQVYAILADFFVYLGLFFWRCQLIFINILSVSIDNDNLPQGGSPAFIINSNIMVISGSQSIYENNKGIIYIVETVLDTKTGKVVTRRKKKASSYKLPYKNNYNKIIREE